MSYLCRREVLPKNAKNWPIALTSHIMKVFEKIVKKRLMEHLENRNPLNIGQHAFRSGRSCISELLEHRAGLVDSFENGFSVHSISLDFSKAFDVVDSGILLRKLKAVGVRGKLGCWLNIFLTGRTQRVVVDGVASEEAPVTSGVLQGTVLGQLLFLIHISDINNNLSSSVTSFSDDTRVIRIITSCNDVETLQEGLFKIYDWAERNNMRFNKDKFEFVKYRTCMGRHTGCTVYGS